MSRRVIAIIVVTVIVIAIIVVWIISNMRNTTYKKIDVELEFIGEIKINPQQSEPSSTAEIKLYYIGTEKLMKEFETSQPYACKLYKEKHKRIMEKAYEIEIEFEEEYDDGKVIFCIGSKIKKIDITGRYHDELTEYKDPIYIAKPTFEDDYDGNVIYFYRVNRADFVLE